MRLVADLGGTHCRLALADNTGALTQVQTFIAAHYSTVEDAITVYLGDKDARVKNACLAVAGPTQAHTMTMTNLSWRTTAQQLNKRFGFEQSAFINDFEAIALSIPALAADELLDIGLSSIDLRSPIAVLGPGTGLGVAQLIPCGHHFMAIATEGGHTSLQAHTSTEQAIFNYWQAQGLALSRESFLSGPGLYRLYAAICSLEKSECGADEGGAVSQLAAQGDALATAAIDVFFSLLGSAAGDQALACGARGGVVLAGGILPKMRNALLNSPFRERFEAKPPMQDYLKRIPSCLIVHENPGLFGASLYPLHSQDS
jgi:glucokinase